ncbi:uncharacterized protein [Henckelia pumila]|uniref:uncharacterized protein n=1 Tax=Henckelia pumila TaxID=405737 RepID=UPI003C6E95F1
MDGLDKYYHCKEPGHISRNYPRKKKTMGRLFVMQAEEAGPDTSLITGKISIRDISTFALLDSRATHYFISQSFIERVGIIPKVSSSVYDITVPSGEVLFTTCVLSGLELELQGNAVRDDLVVLPMSGFDLILGMYWLTVNGALIDFWNTTVALNPTSGDPIIFFTAQSNSVPHVTSCVRASKLLRRGCQGFLASVVVVADPSTSSVEDVDVVRYFSDIFPEDVAGTPLVREVEFSI